MLRELGKRIDVNSEHINTELGNIKNPIRNEEFNS